MGLDTIVQKLLLMFRMVQLYAFIGGTNLPICDVTGFSNFNLVDVHLIATTLAGPGQRYKLYLCFCNLHAQAACLGKGKERKLMYYLQRCTKIENG